jgi:hypothetical protein
MMLAALQHPTALRADHRPAGSALADAARWAETSGAGDDGAVIGLELLTTEPAGRRDDGHELHPAARRRRFFDVAIASK